MKSDTSGSRVSADVNPPLDDQQARLLSILSGRAGEPVTYTELRDAGIEFPAGLIAELELAGVEIDRCRVGVPGGRPVRAVRLLSPVEGHGQAVGEVFEPLRSSEPPSSPPVPPQQPSRLARGSEPTLAPSPPPQPPSGPSPRPDAVYVSRGAPPARPTASCGRRGPGSSQNRMLPGRWWTTHAPGGRGGLFGGAAQR